MNKVNTNRPIHESKSPFGFSSTRDNIKPKIANTDHMILRFSILEYVSIMEFLHKYDSVPIPNKAAAKRRVVRGSIFCHPKYPRTIAGNKNNGIATVISAIK
ncbi:MAG: hypothetical protein EOM59_08470 [Clostridia bacterium]|nr:hypothetical protein [Clostridia bacterium]